MSPVCLSKPKPKLKPSLLIVSLGWRPNTRSFELDHHHHLPLCVLMLNSLVPVWAVRSLTDCEIRFRVEYSKVGALESLVRVEVSAAGSHKPNVSRFQAAPRGAQLDQFSQACNKLLLATNDLLTQGQPVLAARQGKGRKPSLLV